MNALHEAVNQKVLGSGPNVDRPREPRADLDVRLGRPDVGEYKLVASYGEIWPWKWRTLNPAPFVGFPLHVQPTAPQQAHPGEIGVLLRGGQVR